MLKSVASDNCVKGAILAAMPQLGVRNVEHGRIRDCRPIRVVWQKYELRCGIHKLPNQPGTSDPIDLCFLAGDPLHGRLNSFKAEAPISTAWNWHCQLRKSGYP